MIHNNRLLTGVLRGFWSGEVIVFTKDKAIVSLKIVHKFGNWLLTVTSYDSFQLF